MPSANNLQGFFSRRGIPVTTGLICGIVAASVLLFLIHIPLEPFVVTGPSFGKPWAFLTYPFVAPLNSGFAVVLLLVLVYWLYFMGGAVERDLGSPRFAILWVAASIGSALFVILGGFVIRHPEAAYALGSLLPVSVVTVIWGIRNRTSSVLFMMFVPLNGFFLALLTIAIVLVQYGYGNLVLGVFAILPLGLGWLYAENKIPRLAYGRPPVAKYKPSKQAQARQDAYFDEVRKREQERNEKERLRKLFEGSLKNDDSL